MSALAVHLDSEAFGSDADKFNPNRWIHGSADGSLSIEEMNKYWIPFGNGSRQCIGKNVAMMEVSPRSQQSFGTIGVLTLHYNAS